MTGDTDAGRKGGASSGRLAERMKLAARALEAAFWDWDLVTGTMTWSDEMHAIFGLPPSAGPFDAWAAWREAIHPEDRTATLEALIAGARAGIMPPVFSHRIVRPDGSVRWIDTDGDVHFDATGKPVRIVGVSRDVTRRKMAEAAADRQRQTMAEALAVQSGELDVVRRQLEKTAYELTENIPVGIYTFVQRPGERIGTYGFMSSRFLEMLGGLSREALRENPVNGLAALHPDADVQEWVRLNVEAFDRRQPFRSENRFFVDGETRWYAAEDIPRDLPDGSTVWEGVLTDITDRKLAELDLAAARERERATEEAMRAALDKKLRTSLAAAAFAHEINQPLARILLRARTHLDRSPGSDDGVLRSLVDDAEQVVSTIEKMKALLRNVESVQEEIDLVPVVESALDQLKATIRRSGATVTRILPDEACIVRGDAVQLKMALVNLVRNALEALEVPPRDTARRREVSVAIERRDRAVEIVVGDSGPGWTGGTLDEMLLRTSKSSGSGIGLYVAKTAVDHHRGEIRIGASDLGGAEFRVVLPGRPRGEPSGR